MSSKKKTTATKQDGKPALVPKLRFPEFRDAVGWEETRFDEVLSPIVRERKKPGEAYTGLGLRSHGKGTFLKRLEDPAKNAMEYLYEVKCDDLMLNITFAWEGAVAIAGSSDDGALVSHRFPTYTFEKGKASPEFFRYIILDKQFVYSLGVISPGGAGRNRVLSKNDFLKLRVLLPDAKEQQKVAECLSSVDELIAAQARKVDALKTHKKGLIQQLFPTDGETQPRLRFPEFQNAGEWDEGCISDIGTVLQGYGFPERHQGLKNGDYPFYKVSDISKSLAAGKVFIEESANYINENLLKELRAKPIPDGTTVFAKIGEAIRSNKRAITTVPCLIDNNAAGVKRIKGKATDFFIYLVMEQISLIEHAGGVVPAVNKSAIEAIPVKFPEIEEQQRIADCLTTLDDLIAAQTQKLDALKTHKKGLMQQLFPSLEEVEA